MVVVTVGGYLHHIQSDFSHFPFSHSVRERSRPHLALSLFARFYSICSVPLPVDHHNTQAPPVVLQLGHGHRADSISTLIINSFLQEESDDLRSQSSTSSSYRLSSASTVRPAAVDYILNHNHQFFDSSSSASSSSSNNSVVSSIVDS